MCNRPLEGRLKLLLCPASPVFLGLLCDRATKLPPRILLLPPLVVWPSGALAQPFVEERTQPTYGVGGYSL